MKAMTMLAAILALPVVLQGCDRQVQPPSSPVASESNQAAPSSLPNRTIESAPPAAGTPSSAGSPLSAPAGESSIVPPAVDSTSGEPGTLKKE